MATTYLKLVNRALTRLNEVTLTSSNFASATSFQAAVKDYVNDAINYINNAELEWPFNFSRATITLTPSITDQANQYYPLAADLATVDMDSFFIRALDTATPAGRLKSINYDYWRNTLKEIDNGIITGQTGYDKPLYVFQTQDNPPKVGFTPVPDAAYVVEYEYFKVPSDLVNFDDTITIPDRYAHVIVDGAMYYSYKFRDNETEAASQEKKFESGIQRMRAELINRQQDMTNDMRPHGSGVNRGFGWYY